MSGFACDLALCVNLNVDLKVAGTLRVPSALHLGWTAHQINGMNACWHSPECAYYFAYV
ncbi:MAG: hypothetical protein OXM61_09505 [Candidatus Poribacteria bacterium]|nr:hypothetical protein [Candidatus Poribacteria bacterium]